MAVSDEIMSALRDEGYRINEAVRAALDDFLAIVEEENEDIDMASDDDEDEYGDDMMD